MSIAMSKSKTEPEIDETGVLKFVAKNLAVPLGDISAYFHVPQETVEVKLAPLVSSGFVKEQRPGWYSITANGIMQLEQSVKTGLAAYL
jgi:predicted transcriptional regulator